MLVASCVATALLGSGAGALAARFVPTIQGFGLSVHRLDDPQNVLLVGVDDNFDPHGRKVTNAKARTDTLVLASLRPKEHAVHVLSIPRDTQVLIPRYGTDKINAAHAHGGIQQTREVLESLLGITIDHTIEISLSSAGTFLDQLGGIDLYIDQPLHYEDHTAKLLIDFKQGAQHLDGPSAVRFARFRHDALGDIGRVGRQQALMHAVEAKLLDPNTIWRLPQLASTAGNLFVTDLKPAELLTMASFARSKPAVSYATLPGDFGHDGYWIPNHGRIVGLMESMNHQASKAPRAGGGAPLSVEVLYATNLDRKATHLASSLGDHGIAVVRTALLQPGIPTTTRVIGRNGNASLNPSLAKLLPGVAWQLSDDPSPYTADYTVVVGPDFK